MRWDVYECHRQDREAGIIGIRDFQNPKLRRENVKKDVGVVKHALQHQLGFNVEHSKIGFVTAEDAKELVNRLVENARRGTKDMVCLVVLTHGQGYNDLLFSCGTIMTLTELVRPILESAYFVGKPKIFIIVASRDGPGISERRQFITDYTTDRSKIASKFVKK